jgi:hypothetical protein
MCQPTHWKNERKRWLLLSNDIKCLVERQLAGKIPSNPDFVILLALFLLFVHSPMYCMYVPMYIGMCGSIEFGLERTRQDFFLVFVRFFTSCDDNRVYWQHEQQ